MRTVGGKHSFLVSFLTVSFRGASSTLDIAECRRRVPYIAAGVLATLIRLACFTGGLDLFGRPQIGLGEFYVLFRAGNLALVSFC